MGVRVLLMTKFHTQRWLVREFSTFGGQGCQVMESFQATSQDMEESIVFATGPRMHTRDPNMITKEKVRKFGKRARSYI
jgi:hypothetical protein